jgi:hypothetical protein
LIGAVPPVAPDWLPKPDNGQNSVRRFVFWLLRPLIAPQRAIPSPSARSRKSAIERALEFQRLLDDRVVNNRAGIAERHGISRARVTQVLNLLKLPQSVLGLLLQSGREDGSHCTERQLRPILRLPAWAQIAALQQLQEQIREG